MLIAKCLEGPGTTNTITTVTTITGTFPTTSETGPTTGPSMTYPTTTTSDAGGSSVPTGTASAGPTGSTLLPGNLWIRAVEDPNFHKYLQSSVSGEAGPAVMGDYTTAAQFVLTDGQLEQQLPDGVLYLNGEYTGPFSALSAY